MSVVLKGRDDLRQDAVMQQVFQMCNTLLQRNTETRKRKLTICTYKVTYWLLFWCFTRKSALFGPRMSK